MSKRFDLITYPLHLGLGATAVVQPEFTGEMEWYAAYAERTEPDGAEGRLVSVHSFTDSWDEWEVHPEGSEVVVCLSGKLTIHQEVEGELRTSELGPLQAIVNEAGVWHTVDVEGPATALFITAGKDTQNRPR